MVAPSQKSNDNSADKNLGISAESSREEKIEILEREKAGLEKVREQFEKALQEIENKLQASNQKSIADTERQYGLDITGALKLGKEYFDGIKREIDFGIRHIEAVLTGIHTQNKDHSDFMWHSFLLKKTTEDVLKMNGTLLILFQHRKEAACRETIAVIRQSAAKVVDYQRNILRIIERNKEIAAGVPHFLTGPMRLDPQRMQELYEKNLFPALEEIEGFFNANKNIDQRTWRENGKPILEKVSKIINIINWALKGIPPEVIQAALER